MSFREQFDLARNAVFIQRTQQAMVKAAINVVSESPEMPGHSTRAIWATQVLRDPEFYATKIAFGVAANPAITLDSTDNDIEFTVNSTWNAYAGVNE